MPLVERVNALFRAFTAGGDMEHPPSIMAGGRAFTAFIGLCAYKAIKRHFFGRNGAGYTGYQPSAKTRKKGIYAPYRGIAGAGRMRAYMRG